MNEYVTNRVVLEHVTLVFPTSERERVNAELLAGGWFVKRSGPYTDREMWPQLDPSRQLFEIYREVTT